MGQKYFRKESPLMAVDLFDPVGIPLFHPDHALDKIEAFALYCKCGAKIRKVAEV